MDVGGRDVREALLAFHAGSEASLLVSGLQ